MAQTRIRKVAFIGTGIMGAPIAGHILDAGYQLTVFNRTKSKADGLVARGATWADSPAEAVRDADVVFTMVGYPSDVEDIYLTTHGILRESKKGAYLIDLTTSSPQLARDIHGAAEIEDKHAFDCPVTGGEEGAKAGTLSLIIGATEREVEPVLPVLKTFSSEIYYFDKAGGGQTAKLCHQVALAADMVGYAEALALAEQEHVDRHKLVDLMQHGMANSVAVQRLAPRSVDGDFKPGFLSQHLLKDLGLAISEAEDIDLNLPGARDSFDLYDMLCQVGGSRMGTQAVTLLYEDQKTSEAAGLDWSLLDQEEDEAERREDDIQEHEAGPEHHGHGDGEHGHCGHCEHHHHGEA